MVIGKNKKKRQARAGQRNIQRLLQESLDELHRQMGGMIQFDWNSNPEDLMQTATGRTTDTHTTIYRQLQRPYSWTTSPRQG